MTDLYRFHSASGNVGGEWRLEWTPTDPPGNPPVIRMVSQGKREELDASGFLDPGRAVTEAQIDEQVS